MKHASRFVFAIVMTLRLVALLSVLFFTPVFSLAQESRVESLTSSFAELQQYEERYLALDQTFALAIEQNVSSSVEVQEKRQLPTNLLMGVHEGLQRASDDLATLQANLLLADMVTEKQSTEKAREFVRHLYRSTKKRIESSIQLIEKSLPLSRDQETTKLLLEARDLHRAVADYLGRVNPRK